MKKIYKKIMWGFFDIPRSAFEYASQNEWRITVLIAIIFLYMLFGLLFGYLPSWSVK
jgi:hypothetical protein